MYLMYGIVHFFQCILAARYFEHLMGKQLGDMEVQVEGSFTHLSLIVANQKMAPKI